MNMRVLRNLLILAFVGFGAAAAFAHEYKAGDLEIVHPWARATLKGSDVADGFMKIINHGSTPDRLLAVSVEFAKASQIHTMKMDGDVMKMQELTDGLEIPAGATVELKPKSLHIMFMGVNQELVPDTIVNGELTFEKAGKVKIEFMIEPAGTSHSMDNM
ncbi:copper chaperone PCu(A)C [Dongia sedimenti]|uniref:Copper chaperone PCu(A)C n=1 Tax=Dongia sedimenti TaxID=3064282 RepID=A0ABU0YH51_9PROT|nr:copper chaperone PCu(A)C [Rhodospirillaceae bacterium R-7]